MILKNGKRIDGLGDNMPIGSIVEYNGTDIPDGWEILPGDANVYIGPNKPTNEQEVWIQRSKNLFNKNKCFGGWVHHENNQIFVEFIGTYSYTDYIKVRPNTTYTLNLYNAEGLGTGGLLEYDNNFNWTNIGYPETETVITITTSPNTHYVRFTVRDDSVEHVQFEEGGQPTAYEPYVDKKVYIKNEAGSYDLFVKNRIHTGPYQPEDGEEVWIQKSKNLFNINGNVNISGAGGGQTSLNTVSGNVLTSNVNTYSTHNVGQKFTNLNGKTFTVSAKILSVGTGTDGYTAIYDNNVLKKGLSVQAGQTVTLTYTGTTDNIVVGFATASGEGAQFTDIQVEIGNTATDYEPYVVKKIYTKNDKGYEEFYNGEENIYSQEERRIGTWVNGKPLYRKMIPCGYLNAGDQTIAHGVPNIDGVTNARGFFHNTNVGTWFPIPRSYPTNGDKFNVAVDVGKENITLTSGSNYNGTLFYAWIVLEYTKTTD